MDKSQVKAMLERPVAFHKVFGKIGGSAASGLFLSQLYYWTDKGSDKDGWIHKSATEWHEETCLTRRELEVARRGAVALGLLEEGSGGRNNRGHYRLNVDRLCEIVSDSVARGSDFAISDYVISDNVKSDEVVCHILRSGLPDMTNPYSTETTAENTTETTGECATAPAKSVDREDGADVVGGDAPDDRGTRLPKDWQLSDELIRWSRQTFPHIDTHIEAEKFRDFWHAKAGADARKVRWDLTWRTWIRRASEDAANRRAGPAARPFKPPRETQDQIRDRIHADYDLLAAGEIQ